jgi:hypothetical protein
LLFHHEICLAYQVIPTDFPTPDERIWLPHARRAAWSPQRLKDGIPAGFLFDYTHGMADSEALIGFPEEWRSFRERNAKFTERFPRLLESTRRVFDRSVESNEPIGRFVILYGRMCMEEFYEILLMCGNGYGIGAQKILRGLWEKAVTLEHLVNHPDLLDDFFDYHHVSDYKLFNSVRDIIGSDALPQAMIDQNAADYESVKERFTIADCKKCGTTKVNHTWNKLDIVSMSKHTRMLGKLVNEAYYLPMRHTHSSASSWSWVSLDFHRGIAGGLGGSIQHRLDDGISYFRRSFRGIPIARNDGELALR